MKTLFVHDVDHLDSPIPGGVQRCTKDFYEIVAQASEAVHLFAVSPDRRLKTRLKRRLRLVSYAFYDPSAYRSQLLSAVDRHAVDTVVLNMAELVVFAPLIHAEAPHVQIVLMSGGNLSGDLIYEFAVHRQARHRNALRRADDLLWLAGDLTTEARIRHAVPFTVAAMSEEEAVIERWLGARYVFVLPRSVTLDPVPWAPVPRRAGFVGTLNHTPNVVALEAVCDAIAARGTALTLDLVGQPADVGAQFAARYSFLNYLGALDDASLRAAVSRWSVFLNPILWLSKGASMKLADALGWGLPVLTTRSGRRGYEVPDDLLVTVGDDAAVFAVRLEAMLADAQGLRAMHERLLAAEGRLTTVEMLAERFTAHVAVPAGASADRSPLRSS